MTYRTQSEAEIMFDLTPLETQKFVSAIYGRESKVYARLSEYFGQSATVIYRPMVVWQQVPAEPQIGIYSSYWEPVNVTDIGPVDVSYRLFDGEIETVLDSIPEDIREILADIAVNQLADNGKEPTILPVQDRIDED